MNVLVVVPTYNERENLPAARGRHSRVTTAFALLVVDDGSPDGTGSVADQLAQQYPGRVAVLHRSGPRGLGRSYVDGLQRAVADTAVDYVCQMDADLSHNPEYLPALVAAAATHDVVIGSRYLNGVSVVNWPLHRIILSAFANRYIRVVTRLAASDCTSGFRCWRREALARLPLAGMVSDGYAFLVEMLFEAKRRQFRIGGGADHLRRAARGTVEALHERPAGVARHALAARAPAATAARSRRGIHPVTIRHVVVMVTTSYPRFPGDSVGTFMEPIAKHVAARGHEVHVVAPWHPLVTRGREEAGVFFHFFHYAPVAALNVFGYAAGLRADVRCGGRRGSRRRSRAHRAGSRPCASREARARR